MTQRVHFLLELSIAGVLNMDVHVFMWVQSPTTLHHSLHTTLMCLAQRVSVLFLFLKRRSKPSINLEKTDQSMHSIYNQRNEIFGEFWRDCLFQSCQWGWVIHDISGEDEGKIGMWHCVF